MKKLFVILLAAIMVISVSACSSRENNSSETNESSKVSSSQTEESSKSEEKSEEQKKAEEKLLNVVKSQYGKDAKIKFKEEKEINGEKCYLYDMNSGVVGNVIIAIAKDGNNMYQQEVGGGNFLTIDPVVTPAEYFIDLLNTNYAGKLVTDINAVGNQIRGGSFSDYPSDFTQASKFPKISDTEQLIYLYSPETYLDKEFKEKAIVRVILPIADGEVMICDPNMVDDGSAQGSKKLALSNFVFEKNFNLEQFAKDNGYEIRKGSMVK